MAIVTVFEIGRDEASPTLDQMPPIEFEDSLALLGDVGDGEPDDVVVIHRVEQDTQEEEIADLSPHRPLDVPLINLDIAQNPEDDIEDDESPLSMLGDDFNAPAQGLLWDERAPRWSPPERHASACHPGAA